MAKVCLITFPLSTLTDAQKKVLSHLGLDFREINSNTWLLSLEFGNKRNCCRYLRHGKNQLVVDAENEITHKSLSCWSSGKLIRSLPRQMWCSSMIIKMYKQTVKLSLITSVLITKQSSHPTFIIRVIMSKNMPMKRLRISGSYKSVERTGNIVPKN